MAIRQEEDPAADAASEPAGSDEGDARTRPGTTADGTAGEEGDRGHQEDGKGGPDGQFKLVTISQNGTGFHINSVIGCRHEIEVRKSVIRYNNHISRR